MKIAILSAANSIHTVRIANALDHLGHEIKLYSLIVHKAEQNIFSPSVSIEYLNYDDRIGYFVGGKELKKRLLQFQPDVLNAHYASGYGTLATNAHFHPLLLSVWGSDVYSFPNKNFICRKILMNNLRKADTLASTSNIMAKQTRIYLSSAQKERPIFITPFGIDTDLFKPQSKQRPNKNRVSISFVKTISEIYGLRYLLEAFAIAKKIIPDDIVLKLNIYGDGDQMSQMQNLSEQLGIANNVIFHGRIPNAQLPEALCESDIFCAPSLAESFGVSAIEAMACAIPVIASDADGLTEVVKVSNSNPSEDTGFIVPRQDAQSIADKLVILATNPQLRVKMGQNARNHVLDHYDFSKNILELELALKFTASK